MWQHSTNNTIHLHMFIIVWFWKKNNVEIAATQNWFLLEIVVEKEKCIMKEASRVEGGGKKGGTQEMFF